MAIIYARLLNQYKFKYHTLFSASFYEINEEGQRSDEIELYINLKINLNLSETEINNIDVKSHLEHQFQIQEQRKVVGILIKVIQRKENVIKLMIKGFFLC